MAIDISIIIPCYNSGKYLSEALESILSYNGKYSYEIIIIDDGSTEESTVNFLKNLTIKNCYILYQDNKGPAAARNAGIAQCKSKYILFLDSDNKIRTDYIDKGIIILEQNIEVGVVYANPLFFGNTEAKRFIPGQFDSFKILFGNYIDTCTVVRKEALEQAGFFDENSLLIGHEDWDLWIRIGKKKWKFHHINEVLFEYRVRSDSLIAQIHERGGYDEMCKYVFKKHADLYFEQHKILKEEYDLYQFDKQNPLKSFAKYFSLKYFKK